MGQKKNRSSPQMPCGDCAEQDLFRIIAEYTYDWESWIDCNGRLQWLNAAVQRITGYDVAECLAMEEYPLPIIAPEDRERMRDAFKAPSANDVEFSIVRKDGLRTWVTACWQQIFNEEGCCLGFRSSIRDIHARKQAEEKLKDRERTLTNLFGNLPGFSYRCRNDAEWTMEFLSDGVLPLTGYEPHELIGNEILSYNDLIHEDDRAMVWDEVQRALSAGRSYQVEYRIREKNGEVRCVWERGNGVSQMPGGIWMLEGFITDMTERKRAEEALRESEEKFRTIFNTATDGILIAEVETKRFLSCNFALCEMLGYSHEDIKNLRIQDIHPQESVDSVLSIFERMAKEQGVARDVPVKRKDGSVFYADINSSKLLFDGKTCLMGIFRDNSDRRKVEVALRESEERFRSFVTLLPQTLYEADATGRITFVNKAATDIFGYSREEYDGMAVGNLICEEDRARAGEAVAGVLRGEKVPANEYRVRRKNGELAYVIVQSASVYDAVGNVTGIRGIVVDITERKQAEQALRESEERFATVFRASPVAIGITRIEDGFMLEANQALLDMLGYERDELVGHTTGEVGLWVDPEQRRQLFACIERSGAACDVEASFRRKDGERIDALVSMETVSLGGKRCGLGMSIDISERKRMEETLRQNEILLQSTIQSTADGLLVVDGNGRVALANDRFAELWHIPREMLGRRDDEELLNQVLGQLEDPEAFLSKVRQLYLSREVDFDTIFFKDGRIFERLSSPLIVEDQVSGRIWSFRDVTEYKRAEAALRVEHERLISIFDSIGEAIYVSDIHTHEVLYANRELKEMLGFDPIGQKCYHALQHFEMPCSFCSTPILEQLRGRPYRWEYHNPVLDRDFVLFDRLIRWPDGRQVRFEMAIDITERKRVEASLRDSEARYRNLFEAANDAIFVIEAGSGKILDANGRCAELTGQAVSMLKGMDHAQLYPNEEREDFRGLYGEPKKGEREFTRLVHVEHIEGYEIPVQVSARYTHIGDVGLFLAIYRDITELKDIERAMRSDEAGLANLVSERTMELGRALRDLENARRLADIGTLAATVAHELRNPLGVISTAVYNIKSKSADERLAKHIANIEKKVVESDRIISNLLSYSRIRTPVPGEVRIADVLDEALEHLAAKYADIEVNIDRAYTCSKEALISVDRDQVYELVANLLDNAFQALAPLESSRRLVVGCEYFEKRCHLWVEDNGEGMASAQLEKIFEPFFSTRARGIGLGLPLCKQIVQLHGGEIAVKSEVGKGTKVDVFLPVR